MSIYWILFWVISATPLIFLIVSDFLFLKFMKIDLENMGWIDNIFCLIFLFACGTIPMWFGVAITRFIDWLSTY